MIPKIVTLENQISSILPATELPVVSVMCTVPVRAECLMPIGSLISLSPSQVGADMPS